MKRLIQRVSDFVDDSAVGIGMFTHTVAIFIVLVMFSSSVAQAYGDKITIVFSLVVIIVGYALVWPTILGLEKLVNYLNSLSTRIRV